MPTTRVVVTQHNEMTFTHTGCTFVMDKCDHSIRVENASGETVASYKNHVWSHVTQEAVK